MKYTIAVNLLRLLIVAILVAAPYLPFAFVEWTWDAGKWSIWSRLILSIIWLIELGFAVALASNLARSVRKGLAE